LKKRDPLYLLPAYGLQKIQRVLKSVLTHFLEYSLAASFFAFRKKDTAESPTACAACGNAKKIGVRYEELGFS
jgi:hypothetical protein